MFILCREKNRIIIIKTYIYHNIIYKKYNPPQKKNPPKTSDFYVKCCIGILKFCPNYEQQKKMKDNASKLNIYRYIITIVFAVKIVALFTKHFQEQPTFCIKLSTPTN